MSEVYFPLATVAGTFLVLIPALTLMSRAALTLSRRRTASWARFGSETTYAWLVGPTLLPVMWVVSSALHQSEPTRSLDSCLIDHVQASTCLDTLLLLGAMLAGLGITVALRLWREWPRHERRQLGEGHELTRRIARIAHADPHLRSLRIVVVDRASEPVVTCGILRPLVLVDARFVRGADPQLLRAALLHERAHIAGLDTFRCFLARLCLTINPVGSLLTADFERWRSAREAMCDGEAVQRGGEPLALAEGIVRAARFRRGDLAPQVAGLCGHDAAALKLRIALLLDGPPAPVRTLGHFFLAVGLLGVLITPHGADTGLLEHFHFAVERMLHVPTS
ncbi:MAG: hypothetical protein JJ863_36725 [Deltaproteobacteria bacterium]|nr:hypothetical protein [Deltaproteobacteria bacterium]